MPVKKAKISGRAARDKGSRAERKVRDALRKIYPQPLRQRVQRVPLSGAAAMKGDVMDMNDPDTLYEVKNQENLLVHSWWRQTVREAGVKTPVLVITQSWRPFYYLLKHSDWLALVEATGMNGLQKIIKIPRQTKIFDKMADVPPRTIGLLDVNDEEIAVVSEDFYIEVKSLLYEDRSVQ